jgi:uncharacterized protein with GYD domain
MALVTSGVVPRPNFVILGAPKCGTTALSEYLREHPRVFVSRPKEPHYFCDDWDYYYAPGERTQEHYLHLFDDATDDHLAIGEASVWYLYSTTAARNIAAFDPAMRVIVMVRNPVELVPSLHSQLRYMLDEDEPDPERLLEVNAEVEQMGAKVVQQWAVLGPYDFVNIVEAPDEKTIARVSVELAARGTAHFQTLTAIPVDEFLSLLK